MLTLCENRGKGGAVREGVFRARGERVLFSDADGATTFEDLEKLESALDSAQKDEDEEGTKRGLLGIAAGSRCDIKNNV